MTPRSTPLSSDTLRRLGKICVAVAASTPAAMMERAASLLPEFPLVELRLDSLPDPTSMLASIQPLLASHPQATLLATCRRKIAGGNFDGDTPAELRILLEAIHAGCRLVDLSIESARELPETAVADLRAAGASVVLSFHDFKEMADLEAVRRHMQSFHPDIIKIVPTARKLADNLQVLDAVRGSGHDRPLVVAMAMGEEGVPSRLLNLREGSAFTFAAATASEATAPGQIDARTLRDLYRVESIGRSTRIFGVAGDPIRSSMSPLMHNTAFRRAGLDAVYMPLRSADAADLFQFARLLPIEGLSITMPLKQAVIPFLASADELAQKIGAVNTIERRPDGSFHGSNTDVAGILTPLERRLSLAGATVLVLGAGGAARAAVFACASKGARVSILNRTPETAQALAAEAGAEAVTREHAVTSTFDVVINATPAGMKNSTARLPIDSADLRCGLVFDLVYNPIDTPLLTEVRSRGIATISGVEMFVLQGARQFELWTGQPAPEDEMRRVVLAALGERG